MADNDSLWEGFESLFFDEGDQIELGETTPASFVRSTIADHRQILNIIFVIDVSGSMRGQRIAQVNYALENIFKELRRRDDVNSVIKVAVMEFSDDATWVTPQPVPLNDYVFTQVTAQPWLTNYGKAFERLNEKLRRSEFMNPALGEYYAPLILFVTDGEPVDVREYPVALGKLRRNGWFKKSTKYAVAVGNEARTVAVAELLTEFTGERKNVRYADEGEALCSLIEYIAIRGSEVQTSMVSSSTNDRAGGESIFPDDDPSLFSSLFRDN